ncbi:zinc carboxypeptidase [Roseivirga ehrenbergii]|uniref:Peptidase M14 n=1 Tax=Roseivirga ehrenbergii (strain DSM 102268 / JCM 13514 / KCTC 12282 / NCIMB 14502 / KMM 6017) TaxID=279360 RepID=A0A150WZ63_ROSEK|nr:M14 metallopeptidase family protein [Roseivirga ehrenbergii]KYG71780.1 peptidase M14 [Roseivirga ehrenbergii]TCL07522.1 zinc carboxypeptidase [Roseivirga ehrenbergii]
MKRSIKILFALLFLACFSLSAQKIPHPRETFGHEVGADYKLADYDQMLEYYDKLAASTDRVQMIEIGKSVMGRPMKLVFISSEENMKKLEQWREISEKLSRAEISEAEARKLSKEGKAIVWFDGGMHATERAHAQMTSELMWRIASEESEEMQKIRDNVITLVVPVINPDGVDIVVDWYRKTLGTPYESSSPPILYQKYVGHDNNRDWFMNNMPETKAVTTVLYNQWYPQIVHNHHQTAPRGAMIFIPPFRSPVNQKIHPGITTGVNLVGTAMANRFAMKKMPGAIAHTSFSMFWNGGMRTTPYYHNQIGILTETAQPTPTPTEYPEDRMPSVVGGKPANATEIFYPYPYKGGTMTFRMAVDYMLESSMAVLDLAADKKDEFLWNIYSMGRDAIEDKEGAFAYVIPKDQWNPSEAINLTNILMQGGLEAKMATSAFSVNGKSYEAGSVIFYGAQSFRPYLADLMEKQVYPDQFQYPGGPPMPPYDLAGWTLPMQMGVTVDRITENFSASTSDITEKLKPVAGTVSGNGKYGYVFSNKDNLSAKAINRLQKAGYTVSIIKEATDGMEAGSVLVRSKRGLDDKVKEISAEMGLNFNGIDKKPSVETAELNKVKIGIYKSWQANMDEGWSRWMFEQFEFDLDTLHNAEIKNSDLSQYSAIIMPSQSPRGIMNGSNRMPENLRGGIGEDGLAKLDAYAKNGGAIIFFDDASNFAIDEFKLPVTNVLRELKSSEFFIPGSLIRTDIMTDHPLAFGMQSQVAASFDNGRAFKINDGAEGIEEVARYASKDLLMSGWAMGEDKYLANTSAMLNVNYGNGDLVLFGFGPQFRGQPRGTYKLIFNSIYMGAEKKSIKMNKK